MQSNGGAEETMDETDLIQSIDAIATYSPPLHDGTVNRRLVDAALGAGVEVIQGRLAPGGTANRHMHREAWQIILVQGGRVRVELGDRSEEHTSELQSLMRISYAVFCLKKKKHQSKTQNS